MSQITNLEFTNQEIELLAQHLADFKKYLEQSKTPGEDMACITDIVRDSLVPMLHTKLMAAGKLSCANPVACDHTTCKR